MNYLMAIICSVLFGFLSFLILRSTAEYGVVSSNHDGLVVNKAKELEEKNVPDEERIKVQITVREYGIYLALVCLACAATSVFLIWFYQQDISYVVLTSATISILWACSWYDRKYHLIPNRILIFALVIRAGILAVQIADNAGDSIYILLSSAIAAIALMLASVLCRLLSPESIGFGDVKLLCVMGLFLCANHVWSPIFVTLLVLFFYGIYLLIFKKANRKTELPLAPFLLVGTIIAAFLTGA